MTEELEPEHYDIHPATQFLYLVLVIIACLILGVIVSAAVITGLYGLAVLKPMGVLSAESSPEVLNAFKIFQSLSSVFLFLAPPVFFAYLVVREPEEYLKANIRFPAALMGIVLLVMFASAPFMEFLVNINQRMVFPHFLKGVYDWMRNKEDEAARATAILLKMNNLSDVIINLVMIAILPAIAEEFMFRGAIQTIFTRWTKNPHWGVWIAATLFSAMHMQFFGFLPRLLLGVFFGYFVLWSGSIWTSVWGHFINNGTAVVVTYLYQQKKITVNPGDQHVFNYPAYAFSLIITVFLFLIYRKVTEKKQLPVL
jgi:membrane protease YdiL (CAAX protease family)